MTALLAFAAFVFLTLWVLGVFSRSSGLAVAAGPATLPSKFDYRSLESNAFGMRADGAIAPGSQATPAAVERLVDLLDSGDLDGALEKSAPTVRTPTVKRRFDETREFSHEAWKERYDKEPRCAAQQPPG